MKKHWRSESEPILWFEDTSSKTSSEWSSHSLTNRLYQDAF